MVCSNKYWVNEILMKGNIKDLLITITHRAVDSLALAHLVIKHRVLLRINSKISLLMNLGMNSWGTPLIIMNHLLTITIQSRDSEITSQSPQKIMMTLIITSEVWEEAFRT